jgi:UDP-N-acetylmuramoyl-tripeptide--D-alanyl-D-alanine ligase
MEGLYSKFKECSCVCTDSRKIESNSLFFALKGDNFDGNRYALDAIRSGAKYAVVDDKSLVDEAGTLLERLVVVDDVLTTMRTLASYHRDQFDIPVIGITGTNGKTTTKELIAAVLERRYKVTYTQGNLNNHIGVPLTLFTINEDTEIAVVEMGANHLGEIEASVNIAHPTCGLITNVGRAHLEGFGGFEGVKRCKGEMYDYLNSHNGFVFCNLDNRDLVEMVAQRDGLTTMPYGIDTQGVEVMDASSDNPFLSIILDEGTINSNLVGVYNADNILAAVAVGRYFEVSFDSIARAIAEYIPSNNRSQLIRSESNLLIVDAYNANHTSMMAALDNFDKSNFENKALILGDMLELGDFAEEAHRDVLNRARSISGEIYLVGTKHFKYVASDKEHCFDTSLELKEYLLKEPLQGRSILIKGSNGTKLKLLIDVL